jgi:SulP family sulfate permease
MVMAVFLFMRKMIMFSNVNVLTKEMEESSSTNDKEATVNYRIPPQVEVFEIVGPLFFGAVYKFKDAIKYVEKPPKFLIIRMRQVPIIDATGIKTLEEVYKDLKHKGTKLILSEVHSSQVMKELKESRLLFRIGKANITQSFEAALERCKTLMTESS